jgi:hypothetical protein
MTALDKPTYTIEITHTNGSEYEEDCGEETSKCIDFKIQLRYSKTILLMSVNFTANSSECLEDIKTMRQDLYKQNHSVQFDGLNGDFCMSVTKKNISFSGSKDGGDAPWSFHSGGYSLNSEVEKMLDYMITALSK